VKEQIMKDVKYYENTKLIHVNIRSLRKNWDIFLQYILNLDIEWEIILLTEINIKKEEVEQYNIQGYEKFAITREKTTRGGGLIAFTKKKFDVQFKVIDQEENSILEIKLSDKINNIQDMQIILIYRQPTSNKIVFLQKLKDLLQQKVNKRTHQIIIGDININILDNNNDIEDKFDQIAIDNYENMLAGLGFTCKINSPTREEIVLKQGVKYFQQSCIDHLYIKSKNSKSRGGVLTEKLADHYFTIGWIWNQKQKSKKQRNDKESKEEFFYQINNGKIVEEINHIQWDFLDKIEEPETIYDEIVTKFHEIYLKNTKKKMTKKLGKIKNKRKEWITDELVEQIERKNNLWNEIKKSNNVNEELLKRYNIEKKTIYKKIMECKKQFYQEKIKNLQKTKKSVWEVIKELTSKEDIKQIDNEIIHTFNEKSMENVVNDFNINFSSQVTELKIKNKVEHEIYKRGNFSKKITKKRSKYKRITKQTMYLENATETEIINIINELNNTNSTGLDKIKTEHIKQTKENTAKAISKLLNAMTKKEVWPEKLKLQITRPVYKKGNKLDLNNYRPIALLSVIDKILEKFFVNKIWKFFDKFRNISSSQFGYRKKMGTNDLLSEMNDLITTSLNDGKYVGIVLIDLTKAFDTFDKKILLNKCYDLGLRGKIYNI
jgi:hypothetical protein